MLAFSHSTCVYRHTGTLEAYHNLVLMYNPKRIHFRYECIYTACTECVCVIIAVLHNSPYSYDVFRARTLLAAIDHNFHLGRQQIERAQGPAYHRQWRRRSKEWDVTPVKEKSHTVTSLTFRFVAILIVYVCFISGVCGVERPTCSHVNKVLILPHVDIYKLC